MGIKGLNTYIKLNHETIQVREESKEGDGTSIINLSDLCGKRIVVDASIYMYRCKAQNELVCGMYTMISLLKYHGAILYFVFDGRPPPEKLERLEQRRNDRKIAKKELSNMHKVNQKRRKQHLQRQSVSLNNEDISSVKELLRYMGIQYTTALGEAERLCAKLVVNGQADACLSDDTDMFAYRCPVILRYLSVINETVIKYDFAEMINKMDINSDDFCVACIAAGTDYNDTKYNFNSVMYQYNKYCLAEKSNTFVDFLIRNTDYIPDESDFWKIYKMYDIMSLDNVESEIGMKELEINIMSQLEDSKKLENFLSEYGFMFV